MKSPATDAANWAGRALNDIRQAKLIEMTRPKMLAGGVSILLIGGCGGPAQTIIPLVQAGGIVTLDGAPLENAVVIFESPDGSFSYAQTDADGFYQLRFDSETTGVAPGPKTIRISMNRRIFGLNSNDEGGPDDRAGGAFPKQPPERVPAKYNAESELKLEVTAERGRYDFEL